MSSRAVRLITRSALLLAAAALLAACGSDSSKDDAPTISESKLVKEIEQELGDEFDTEITASCDGGMDATKGEEKRCTGSAASEGDLEQNIRVRVEQVTDGKASLDVVIFKKIALDQIEEQFATQLAEQLGPDVSIDCGEELPDLEQGVEFDCAVEGSAEGSTNVAITVGEDNEVDSLDYELS